MRTDAVENRMFLDPVLLGRYPSDAIGSSRGSCPADAGAFEALVQDGDLEVISAPLDVLAVQYYGVTGVDERRQPGRRSTRRRRRSGSRCTPRASTTC